MSRKAKQNTSPRAEWKRERNHERQIERFHRGELPVYDIAAVLRVAASYTIPDQLIPDSLVTKRLPA